MRPDLSDRELVAELAGDDAAALLDRFASLGHMLAADASRLASHGASARTIGQLHGFREVARRLAWLTVSEQAVFGTHAKLLEYLQVTLAHETVEQLRVLFLDLGNRLIADELMSRGTINHAPVYPREIVKRALALDATAIIVVHNHPSGDPAPSRADIEMTREIRDAAKALGIELHDHVVIGHRHVAASFRALGLLR